MRVEGFGLRVKHPRLKHSKSWEGVLSGFVFQGSGVGARGKFQSLVVGTLGGLGVSEWSVVCGP